VTKFVQQNTNQHNGDGTADPHRLGCIEVVNPGHVPDEQWHEDKSPMDFDRYASHCENFEGSVHGAA
jgi:hypothetical protein